MPFQRNQTVNTLLILSAFQAIVIWYYLSTYLGCEHAGGNGNLSLFIDRSPVSLVSLQIIEDKNNAKISSVSESEPCSNYSAPETTVWNLTGETRASGPHPFPSKARLDLLLTVRKLILFAVHELNEKNSGNSGKCLRWWANPRSASLVSKTEVSVQKAEWKLKYELEPGRVPVEVVILQNLTRPEAKEINLKSQRELALISARRLDLDHGRNDSRNCEIHQKSSNPRRSVRCFCSERTKESDAETIEARIRWNKTDPELPSWPPSASFLVSDYIDFLDAGSFRILPRNSVTRLCGSEVELILMISSAPNHFEMREAIRETFGNKTYLESRKARLVFLFGSVSNLVLQVMKSIKSW
jgi:hypothetical protein